MSSVIRDYIFGIRRCYGPEIHHGAETIEATYCGKVVLDWGEQASKEHRVNLARVILSEFANTQVADVHCEAYAVEVVKFDHDKFNLVRDQIEEWLKFRRKDV